MRSVHSSLDDMSSLEKARLLSRTALAAKAEELVILDVRQLSSFADYFVIMSGRSTRHVQGLAEAVGQTVRHKRLTGNNCEGLSEGHWVLLDYDDVVVHIFYHESRGFYDLEGLWHDAPRVEVGHE
ncbi:MAG: ribosome silencing factor [Thermodesulfobacteriota bacterium]